MNQFWSTGNHGVYLTLTTKAEMIETMHANNQELLIAFDQKIDTLREEMRADRQSFREDLRADRRWLIGVGITIIIAIPTLLKLLGHF